MTTNVMLAHTYDSDKHKTKVNGWWISEKYDGVRAKWNGKEMETRVGNIYVLPDFITEQLKRIVDEDGNPIELDGELWGGIDTFAFMSGIARSYEKVDSLWKDVKYMVFDTPNTDLVFEKRIKNIKDILMNTKDIPNIDYVKYKKYDPETMSIESELGKVESKGGEGIMLRKPGSFYEFKRSHNMLKVKSWMYKEATVYGYEAGKAGKTGKTLGMVGSLLVKTDAFGPEVKFKVGSGLTDWQRQTGELRDKLSESKKWSKELQEELDSLRSKIKYENGKETDEYKELLEKIKKSVGKERTDLLHRLNEVYAEIPGIKFNNLVTFKYKELTKDGIPSMPTFVAVRSDLILK